MTGSPRVTGRRVLWSPVACILLTALAVTRPADAAHAMDHRYVVLGYVRDREGRPVPRAPVLLVREKTGLPYHAETDARGFFVLVVHLHDEDLLDALHVVTEWARTRIAARFNPLNPERPRGTRIDFTGTQAREHQDLFAPALEEFLRQ